MKHELHELSELHLYNVLFPAYKINCWYFIFKYIT